MRKDEMLKDNQFGRLLESLHVKKGWTQEDAAAHLEVSRGTYSAWVRGKRLPSLEQLKHIAATFKLNQVEEDELYRAAAQVPPEVDTLPSQQNPFFTGREKHLERLNELLQETGTAAITQAVSISGLGGIGKTQLALEYAHRHYGKAYRAVLWVNAADEMTLRTSYDELIRTLDLPEQGEREADRCVHIVKQWLEGHTDWLLIMDNADDLPLARSFLPAKPLGHIIFTTRSQIVRDSGITAQINVEEMKPEEGLRFLLRRTGKLEENVTLDDVAADDRETALQLVELLGGHPLALDQAGAYIEETDKSFAEYITLYQTRRRSLLDRRKGLVSKYDDDSKHPESVVVTIELCIEMAQKQHPLASYILRFCAFFHPDDIPQEMLEWESSLAPDTMILNEGIASLRRYSLIQTNRKRNAPSLSVHQVVQAVVEDSLSPGERRHWKERVVKTLSAAFVEAYKFLVSGKEGLFSYAYHYFDRMVPHILRCLSWDATEITAPEDAVLMSLAASDFSMSPRRARVFLKPALMLSEICLGNEHPLSILTVHHLAYSYYYERLYGDAEPLYERAVSMYEKWWGDEDDRVQMCLSQLAVICAAKGDYERAISLWCRRSTYKENRSSHNSSEEIKKRLSRYVNYPFAGPLHMPVLYYSIETEHPAKSKMLQTMKERQEQSDAKNAWLLKKLDKLPKFDVDGFIL